MGKWIAQTFWGGMLGFAALLPAHAEGESGRPIYSINFENDIFARSDRGYTNGILLRRISGPGKGRKLAQTVLGADDPKRTWWAIGAGQSMFTPTNIERPEPLPDQHPYAGWLYIEGTSMVERSGGDVLDMLSVAAGVVGPSALAEDAQRTVHRIVNAVDPLGWDNQLRNEPGLYARFDRIWRVGGHKENTLDFDILPYAGAAVGNVITEARMGATFRMGRNLRSSWGPTKITPSRPGPGVHAVTGFSWSIFASLNGRAVARNIFLDGNTWRDSLSVDSRVFIGAAEAGASVQKGGFQLSFTKTFRTEEFVGQEVRQDYGVFSISKAF